MQSEKEVDWAPLESNPEVINAYVSDLGFDVTKFRLIDVIGTEDWALEMVPKPVLAVIFLYPINNKQEAFRKEEEERIKGNPQEVSNNVAKPKALLILQIFFMEQHAENACGTVAMLHSIINLYPNHKDLVENNSFISKFIEATKTMDPHARGQYLKGNKELETAHKAAVEQGESEIEECTTTHFIAFVIVDGDLYELDGRKSFPINHGQCSQDEILTKSSAVIRQFMERDPDEIKFTIMALAPPMESD